MKLKFVSRRYLALTQAGARYYVYSRPSFYRALRATQTAELGLLVF